MDEMSEFELEFGSQLKRYASPARGDFDPVSIAHAAVSGSSARPGIAFRLGVRGPSTLERRSMSVMVLILVALLLALVTAILGAALQRPPIGDPFSAPLSLAWSPDGSKLAFLVDAGDGPPATGATGGRASHQELWMVSADGSGRTLLARLPSNVATQVPLWSPDGRHLALAQPRAGTPATASVSDAVVVGLDGAPPRILADGGAGSASIVSWSPAGDRLLYNRSDGSGSDIYTVSLVGTDLERLTSSHRAFADGWSPDGSSILYTDGVINGTQTADSATWVMRSDGSAKVRLGPCCDVGWSADGTRAYFETEGGPLLSAAADGRDQRTFAMDHAPYGWALSPDGARYAAQAGSGIEVATLGGPRLHLTTDGGDSDPRWSPDGRWIAFWGTRAGVVGLYVASGDGGQPALVATDASSGGSDPWQPTTNGGSRLAFMRDRAILTVKSDGSDPRELASRTTIAGAPRVPTTGDSTFQERMVIGPDGPDRDIYRVTVGRTLGFTFENRTGDPWFVRLDGWDILAGDCRITAAGTIILAAYRPNAGSAPSAPATPPDFCLIPPHRSVSVTIPDWLRGPAEVRVGRSGTDNGEAYPVIFDRDGSE